MKNLQLSALLMVLMCVALSIQVQAQTKKQLKAENAQLKAANTVLQQRVQELEKEKKQMNVNNEIMKEHLLRLRRDSATASMDYQLLSAEYTKFKEDMAEKNKKVEEETGEGFLDEDDTRPCALKQAQLEAGFSYDAVSLSRVRTKGYGVQVYSYSNLCNALEKAEDFMKYYKMYKTYIKVKYVNGKKRYSVVYGSLKDEGQARTYTELFKKNARVKERASAFLVRHEDAQ